MKSQLSSDFDIILSNDNLDIRTTQSFIKKNFLISDFLIMLALIKYKIISDESKITWLNIKDKCSLSFIEMDLFLSKIEDFYDPLLIDLSLVNLNIRESFVKSLIKLIDENYNINFKKILYKQFFRKNEFCLEVSNFFKFFCNLSAMLNRGFNIYPANTFFFNSISLKKISFFSTIKNTNDSFILRLVDKLKIKINKSEILQINFLLETDSKIIITSDVFNELSKNLSKKDVMFFGDSLSKLSLIISFSNYFLVNYIDLDSCFFKSIESQNVKDVIIEIYKHVFYCFSSYYRGVYV